MREKVRSRSQGWVVIAAGLAGAVAAALAVTAWHRATRERVGAVGTDPTGAAGEARPAPPAPVTKPEVWRLVKIELATDEGTSVETVAGVQLSFRAEPARSGGGAPQPARKGAAASIKETAKGAADGWNEDVAQPVEFSHAHHASQLGIHCRYCHSSNKGEHFDPIPATKTCLNCHQQIWKGSDLLAPVRHPGEVAKGEPGAGVKAEPEAAPAVRRRWFVVRRDAEKSPKEIDLTECDADGRVRPGAALRRGIYDETPAGLVVALPYQPAADGFRPREFRPTPLASTGVAVFHLAR